MTISKIEFFSYFFHLLFNQLSSVKKFILWNIMFHSQWAFRVILFIITISIAWPLENEDSNTCFQLSGSDNGDAKCSPFCRLKSKTEGSCKKNHGFVMMITTVKITIKVDNNKGKESKRKDRSLTFSTKSTSNIDLNTC